MLSPVPLQKIPIFGFFSTTDSLFPVKPLKMQHDRSSVLSDTPLERRADVKCNRNWLQTDIYAGRPHLDVSICSAESDYFPIVGFS